MRLLVEVAGLTVPLEECWWVRANQNGCALNSAYGDEAMNSEDAHKFFVPRKRDRERDSAKGYTVQLLTKEQWQEQALPCFLSECNHPTTAKAA